MISIIVPVYNAHLSIGRCIESIQSQNYHDIEIILVDDGSTDDSFDIIKSYQRTDERIKVLKQKNSGPNAARANGLNESNGDWISFVDSDDCLSQDFCSTMIRYAIEAESEIVGCAIQFHDYITEGEIIRHIAEGTMSGHEVSQRLISIDEFYAVNHNTSFWGYIFSAPVIKTIFNEMDYDIRWSEDVIGMLLALWDAKRVGYIEEPLYCVYTHRNSLTKSHAHSFYQSEKNLYRFGTYQMRKRNMPDESYNELQFLIIRDLLLSSYSEAFGHLDELYPFDGVYTGSRVVVYGAGEFGYELVKYIRQSGKYILVGCLDRKAPMIKDSDFPCKVSCPDEIRNMNYDYVVIAVTKPEVRASIKKDLHTLDIPDEKIKDVDINKISYDYLPESFFEGVVENES